VTQVVFGPATLDVPDGWTEEGREGERIMFLSEDKVEHATISYRTYARNLAFSEFEQLVAQRLDAERAALKDGFLETKGAVDGANGYTLIFFGGDRETARMFSGLLILQADVLLALYIEGVAIEPQRHMDTFAAFARGCQITHGNPISST
jgi:hypothetical protein